MCEHVDEEVTHIDNIFNTIEMEENGEIAFDIITFLNCIGEPEDFYLVYMLHHQTRKNGGRTTFLGATEYRYDKGINKGKYIQNLEKTHYSGVRLKMRSRGYPLP